MEKAGRYFALLGAIIGGIAGFYLLIPIAVFFNRELSILESAGILLVFAGIIAAIFYFVGRLRQSW